MSTHSIRLTVNGTVHELTVPARLTLADLLRDRLDLTAAHLGCEQGVCGACTVRVDGRPARSCTTLAVQVDGASVETVEGLSEAGRLAAIQAAFWERHGLQCGFCTPGLLISVLDLLERDPAPSADAIQGCVGGHLCRCTGYRKIVEAIEDAAVRTRAQVPAAAGAEPEARR